MSSALHPERLLICVVAVATITAAIPAPVAASVASAADPRVEFADPAVHHEQRGDIVEVGVRVSGTDTATLRIGSPHEQHLATVTARDADGDSRVTIRFDTSDGTFEATGEDTVAVRERSNASTPVASGTYDLELWPGDEIDGAVTAVSRLTVAERSTDGLRTWVAPEPVTVSNLTEIRAAMGSENLTRSPTVTPNDTFVLELRASGLEGALATENSSNTTERFFSLLEGDAAELQIRQTNPGPERRAAEIDLTESDSTRVIADPANDTYYLVADLREANVTRGTQESEIYPGHEYEANFSLSESSALVSNGTESVTTTFEVVEPAVTLSTSGEDGAFAEPAPNQTLYGRTSLPLGSEVTVEIGVTSNERQFLETVQVRNDSDGPGRFAATFDLSDVPDGATFTVDVRAEAYPDLDFEEARIVVSEPTAHTEFSTVRSTSVSVDATLSHGGFVAVHRGSADGPVLGDTRYLDAGTDENAYVDFSPGLESNETVVAVAYRDTDRDGTFDPEVDEPYVSEESVVSDAAEFTVEPATSTTPTTTTPTTSQTTAATTADEPTPDLENEESLPGFGVGGAVVALLAVALLARER